MTEKLQRLLVEIGDLAKDEGVSFVGVLLHYDGEDTNFSTRLSVTAVPDEYVTEDHIVLDAMREISSEWSRVVHGGTE